MRRRRSHGRVGIGHLAGTVGAFLLCTGAAQPLLRLDGNAAFVHALTSRDLDPSLAARILTNFGPGGTRPTGDPEALAIARQLGVESTGLAQDPYVAGALLVAALLALVAVIRSLRADTAWRARRPAPLLTLSAVVGLAAMGVLLWLLAPDPRDAMRPDIGMWLVLGGCGALLLGSATLGSNHRRAFIDEDAVTTPPRMFENTDHLAFGHGAWVPRGSEDRR